MESPETEEMLSTMKRADLQKLAKKYGVKANMKVLVYRFQPGTFLTHSGAETGASYSLFNLCLTSILLFCNVFLCTTNKSHSLTQRKFLLMTS